MNQNPAIAAAAAAAMEAVKNTAEKDSNNVSIKSVTDAQPEMTKEIEKQIAADPKVQHATNTEAHFWQKRTFWATLAASGAALVPATNAFLDYMQNHAVDGKVTAFTVLFAAWAGYSAARAGIAVAPLGARYPANKG